MKKKLIIYIILVPLLIGGASVAFAQNDNTGTPIQNDNIGVPKSTSKGIPTLGNPLKAKNVTELLYSIVDILIFLGVIIAVFVFIFVGFKFVWAQGNEDALKDAKKWFFYAVIGTAILLSSKVIVEVIKNTLISAGVVDQKVWNKPK